MKLSIQNEEELIIVLQYQEGVLTPTYVQPDFISAVDRWQQQGIGYYADTGEYLHFISTDSLFLENLMFYLQRQFNSLKFLLEQE